MMKIKSKILLFIISLVILTSSILTWLQTSWSIKLLRQEMQSRGVLLVQHLAALSAEGIAQQNIFGNLEPIILLMTRHPDVSYVIILDASGKVLAHNVPGRSGKIYQDELTQKALSSPNPAASLYSENDKNLYDFGLIVAGKPLPEPGAEIDIKSSGQSEKLGAVRIGLSLKAMEQQIRKILSSALIITLALILLAVSVAFYFTGKITRPIRQLTEVIRDISTENLTMRVSVSSRDEVGQLAGSFNRMIESLEKSTGMLKSARTKIENHSKELESKLRERTAELEKIFEQLRRADKLASVGMLSAGIAHNFNNVLCAIMGNAQLMKLDVTPDSEHYRALEIIEHSAQKGAGLSQKLLAFSRKTSVTFQSTNLNETVENTLDMIKNTFEKMIEVKTVLQPDLWPVKADAGQISEVLLNLCINAKEAMLSKGEGILRIETNNLAIDENYAREHPLTRPGNFAVISVSDTGVGMDRDTQDKLFQPFFTTKPVGQGTGLGLAVTYGIIKSHEGFISVQSESGKGSCFKLYLPKSSEPPVQNKSVLASIASKTMGKSAANILLVDDEPDIREVALLMLKRVGYHVITAGDGQSALKLYQAHKEKIDLVILDVIMPGWSGLQTLEELKKVNPGVKVLICSGYSENLLELMTPGTADSKIDGFIQKPYVYEHLIKEVNIIIDNMSK